MNFQRIADTIGNTPLVRIQRLPGIGRNVLLLKLEGNNPAGSVKDRPAYSMIRRAAERGEIKPGDTLIEATSGNTGIALAMAAAIMGFRMRLIMPEHLSVERRAVMKAFGAEVVLVTQQQGMEYARDLAAEMQRAGEGRVLDQFANPDNPRAHYEGTAPEIWRDTAGRITHFVSSMGTTGTIMGCSKFFKEKNPAVQIVGVQPDGESSIPGIRKWPQAYLPRSSTARAWTASSRSVRERPRTPCANWPRSKACSPGRPRAARCGRPCSCAANRRTRSSFRWCAIAATAICPPVCIRHECLDAIARFAQGDRGARRGANAACWPAGGHGRSPRPLAAVARDPRLVRVARAVRGGGPDLPALVALESGPARGGRPDPAQSPARPQSEPLARARHAARGSGAEFRRWPRPRRHAASAGPAGPSWGQGEFLLHRAAGATPPRAGARGGAPRAQRGKPQRPPFQLLRLLWTGPLRARAGAGADAACCADGSRAALFPRADGPAQSAAGARLGRRGTAAGELDPARLRQRDGRPCARPGATDPRTGRGRRAIAPRRRQRAHARRPARGAGRPARLARTPEGAGLAQRVSADGLRGLR